MATYESFKLESLCISDLERVLNDLRDSDAKRRRFRSVNLIDGLTWARSATGTTYLIKTHPGELEGVGRHYLLFCAEELFEAQTTSVTSDTLRFVDFPHLPNLARAEVKRMFLAALTVYGKWGKGQDGHFNTDPDHEDVLFNQCIPAFEEDR